MEKGEKITLPCGAVVTVENLSAGRHSENGGLIGFQIDAGDGALMATIVGSDDDYHRFAKSVKLNLYGQNIRTLINILERADAAMQAKLKALWPSDPIA